MRRAELHPRPLDRLFPPSRLEPPDVLLAERLERSLGHVTPDPLFRRRLRGAVLNEYVARREGLGRRARRPRRQMGVLGRAVLYASFVLVVSVSAVGAASQSALPGDLLYGIKLRLEEIRMQVAPPSVRDDLAAMALAERTRELQQLVEAGAWSHVPAAAELVASAEDELASVTPDGEAATATSHTQEVLESVIERAPEAALPGLQHALQATTTNAANPQAPGHLRDGNGDRQGAQDDPSPSERPAHPSQPPQAGGNKGKPATDGS
jgi:Domain of unknown function (DUF5667)